MLKIKIKKKENLIHERKITSHKINLKKKIESLFQIT